MGKTGQGKNKLRGKMNKKIGAYNARRMSTTTKTTQKTSAPRKVPSIREQNRAQMRSDLKNCSTMI